MSKNGHIVWTDLTVPDATQVRDFYSAVVGWKSSEVDMGGYADYSMSPPDADNVAVGVCHKRGANADLPSQWLVYIQVPDLDASLQQCQQHGGAVVAGPKAMGPTTRYCVIRDPAGAVCALYEEKA